MDLRAPFRRNIFRAAAVATGPKTETFEARGRGVELGKVDIRKVRGMIRLPIRSGDERSQSISGADGTLATFE